MKNISFDLGVRNRFFYISLMILSVIIGFYFFCFMFIAKTEAEPRKVPELIVDVEEIIPQNVVREREFDAQLAPVKSAEIRPQLAGIITDILFEEGAVVKEGQRLFIVDPDLQKSSLSVAEARLAAALSKAEMESNSLMRAKALLEKKLISPSAYDSSQTSHAVAVAEVDQAKALLTQAKKGLEYAYITAQIDGRIGRAELTVGNVVSIGASAPLLTTIVENNEFYADFHLDEQTYMDITRDSAPLNTHFVRITRLGANAVSYSGELVALDNQFDRQNGTIRARAKFRNIDGVLRMGMHVTVLLGISQEQALLVPNKSIGTSLNKKYVYLISSESRAVYREVVLGDPLNNHHIVVKGIRPGDKIIKGGLPRIRPNSKVIIAANERR